ncbi:MAG TPA: PSD1 and planctomycete cytochrome C domain-containing protein [Opitutaceae bacterium]|nr:PSD1 and planctomycete cytochrome C domain-containing protein [Opitutaceae bacterium]
MHPVNPAGRRLLRLRAVLPLLGLCGLASAGPAQAADDEAGIRFFHERIEPVLQRECYECHSAQAKKLKANLHLDSKAGMLAGGDSGAAVKPGDGESLILQAIRHQGDLEMPPDKPPLGPDIIADFEQWVKLGAPDPRADAVAPVDPKRDPAQARLNYWAFQPVKPPAPPAVKRAAWVANPIDRFVLAKLEAAGLQPAPAASKAELVRRVYFDLTGLPPSPEEVQAFLGDRAPDAYERLVDRLLASPHYGEQLARDWLDVVRYAESEGFEYDRHLPDAWRFRDYVINALNRDKPFDRFLTEQLAGDEIAPGDQECESAAIFHRLGPVRRNAGNPEIAVSRNEVLIERTDIIGASMLGLTIGCARCHDHKFDPILQKDYYRLQAYLAETQENDQLLVSAAEKKQWEDATKVINDQLRGLRKTVTTAEGEDRKKLNDQIDALEDQLPPYPATIPGIRDDPAQRTEIHVLKRGDWDRKGDLVAPRPPTVLVSDDRPESPADLAQPRAELARWITDPKNPLTPRVAVNRLWQHHFGFGLVKTPNDFGQNGDRPSHPELLDWLASQLMEHGWSLKAVHREILLSSTYRQSSQTPQADAATTVDPENRLLWHVPRRRLSAEEIRDAMLAVSGELNPKIGGPSVMVPVDPDQVKFLYKPSQWSVAKDPAEFNRRSVYLIAKRNLHLTFMETFDQPDLLSSCGRRESSTHAPQALELMNGKLSNDLAAALAARLTREAGTDHGKIVDRAYWLATGRAPTPAERKLSLAFLQDQPLKEFALVMFNLNDFLYAP